MAMGKPVKQRGCLTWCFRIYAIVHAIYWWNTPPEHNPYAFIQPNGYNALILAVLCYMGWINKKWFTDSDDDYEEPKE